MDGTRVWLSGYFWGVVSGERDDAYAFRDDDPIDRVPPRLVALLERDGWPAPYRLEQRGVERMAHTYEVIVGNVGKVHDGDDEQAARTVFDSYARQSVHALNRVTGESVWLYRDGEIVDEYVGASARAPEEG